MALTTTTSLLSSGLEQVDATMPSSIGTPADLFRAASGEPFKISAPFSFPQSIQGFNTTATSTAVAPSFIGCNQVTSALLAPATSLSSHSSFPPLFAMAAIPTKRSLEDSDDVFVKAQKQARNHYISELNEDSSYAAQFLQAMVPFKHQCAFCVAHNATHHLHHTIVQCPLLIKNRGALDIYLGWRKTIYYRGGKMICFKCHVPANLSPQLHGPLRKGSDLSSCLFPDIVGPIAFYVFHNSHVQSLAANHFKVQWPTLIAFTAWLVSSQPIEPHYSNFLAILFWFVQYRSSSTQ